MLPINATVSGTTAETTATIGFGLNGAVLFSALETGGENAVEPIGQDAPKDARWWHGHPTAKDIWHYHNPRVGNDENNWDASTLLGYAMDGFPIYGHLGDIAAETVLDPCNFDSANGRYHVRTLDQVNETAPYCDGDESVNWKYILGCYVGTLHDSAIYDSVKDFGEPDGCTLEYCVGPAGFC